MADAQNEAECGTSNTDEAGWRMLGVEYYQLPHLAKATFYESMMNKLLHLRSFFFLIV